MFTRIAAGALTGLALGAVTGSATAALPASDFNPYHHAVLDPVAALAGFPCQS